MAILSQEDISRRIRDQWKLLDPEISLEVGTVERRLVDIFSSELASVNVDSFVNQYQFDVDTRFGQDLDDLLGLFGFARQTAKRATGTARFLRGTPAPSAVVIPHGTQIMSPGSAVTPQVLFHTIGDAIIPENGTYVNVPIEAEIAGENGNVVAGAISIIVSNVSNASEVTNLVATTGGTEDETDEAFRTRFRNTVFRNIAGTKDQFLALAIASAFTDRALILTPVQRFAEYMQIDSDGVVTSGNPHSKYTYDFDYFLSDDGTETGVFYYPNIDYTFEVVGTVPKITIGSIVNAAPVTPPTASTGGAGVLTGEFEWAYSFVYTTGETAVSPVSSPPLVLANQQANLTIPIDPSGSPANQRNVYRRSTSTVTWTKVGEIEDNVTTAFVDNNLNEGDEAPRGTLQDGSIVFFEYNYISKNSRNDITLQALNKVDIYISGEDVQTAVDVLITPNSTKNFNNTLSSPYYVGNYERDISLTPPSVGNRFLELLWTPVRSLPTTMTINSTPYELNTDFWLVRDKTNLQGSMRARDGIELSAAMASAIEGQQIALTYTFNRLPLITNKLIDAHRQIGQDVLVHAARLRYFKVNIVVMYSPGSTKTFVDDEIERALTRYFTQQGFGPVIQISDILQAVHNVTGVDNVRLATTEDAERLDLDNNYGIQEVNANGVHITNFESDFLLEDIELPVFNGLGPTLSGPEQRTQNTFTMYN